jgi:hypothetical protein
MANGCLALDDDAGLSKALTWPELEEAGGCSLTAVTDTSSSGVAAIGMRKVEEGSWLMPRAAAVRSCRV